MKLGLQQAKSLHRHTRPLGVYIRRLLANDLGTESSHHCDDNQLAGARKGEYPRGLFRSQVFFRVYFHSTSLPHHQQVCPCEPLQFFTLEPLVPLSATTKTTAQHYMAFGYAFDRAEA